MEKFVNGIVLQVISFTRIPGVCMRVELLKIARERINEKLTEFIEILENETACGPAVGGGPARSCGPEAGVKGA